MSDLQIVLIIIGALIIVGVIVFNWWQEHRFHKQVESNFSPLKNDALFDNSRQDLTDLNIEVDHFFDDKKQANQDEMYQPMEVDAGDEASITSTHLLNDDLIHTAPINEVLPRHMLNTPPEALKTLHSESFQDLTTDIKNLSQHDDIKLIFNEVFSKSAKASSPDITSVDKLQVQSYEQETAAPDSNISVELKADVQDADLSLPAMLHSQVDLTAVLYLAKEASVNTISRIFSEVSDGYDKPVFVHVFDANKQWSLLKDISSNSLYLNQQISKVTCSLQLADRAGAVSRYTLNRFQLAIETLGLDMNAHVEWQGTGDALTAATTLDTFCIEVDKTIGFHLIHGENGAFTGTKLKGLAEVQGFTMASDGTFKYFEKDPLSGQLQSQPSFVMFNRDDYPFTLEMLRTSVVKGITFQLDIPRVKHCAEAYSQMVQVARQMEVGLHAELVADNNKVLGEIQIEKIRQQLKVIHATMLTRGIIPGSDCALRLFS
ncbi:hypothetical protein GALL_18610 [mine drainage metagenome]|uniref:ZipA C-terminal FtsZ-binding domain-containing protein n=1 Tax=mine drainage metagenome TaxID=410659 RepID=A0A1J5TC06_9ZZZZ